MTKKDYIKFADMIGTIKTIGTYNMQTIERIQEEIINIFEADNEKFDADKFKDYIYKKIDERVDGV